MSMSDSKGVYVQITDITPEQIALRDKYYEAAKMLRQAGFPCEVVHWCTFGPNDNPASINLLEKP